MDSSSFKTKLLVLPTSVKRLLQFAADIFIIWLALWLSFVVRLGADIIINPFGDYFELFIATPIFVIPSLIYFKLYKTVNRYFDNEAIIAIFKAISLSSLLLVLAIYWYQPDFLVPRSIVFIFWWVSIVLLVGFRLLVRHYLLRGWNLPFARKRNKPAIKVAIYGAGAAGNQLATTLRMGKNMQPVAFVDDDVHLYGRSISGLKVYGPEQIEKMIIKTSAEEILLAIPSVSRARRREILSLLEQYPLRVRSIPGFMDLASGRVKVDDIQEIDIVDVLGRDIVPPNEKLFEHCINNKTVLVTGAGGSIGTELCRQITTVGVKTLLLFDHSEFNLYSIHLELLRYIEQKQLNITLIPILGSVRNTDLLLKVMDSWQVETIYHAAAYKHVPMVEQNISEGILNNVIGTLNVAQVAILTKVKNFVLVSTDKAVRPTNVMGATKRLAEMTLQALSREFKPILFGLGKEATSQQTCFTMVRFGNVLGSSGSVIPLFRKQIKEGGPITVTHPEVTRYFMTIPEAAQLVIQAGSMGEGGDVFVLDMGSPVKIIDLAEKMVHLSGLTVVKEDNPDGDISIQFTGLRPGEKLYEELLIGENVIGTDHPMIMCANEEYLSWEEMKNCLKDILLALEQEDYEALQALLMRTVSGYHMDGDLVDWNYLSNK